MNGDNTLLDLLCEARDDGSIARLLGSVVDIVAVLIIVGALLVLPWIDEMQLARLDRLDEHFGERAFGNPDLEAFAAFRQKLHELFARDRA